MSTYFRHYSTHPSLAFIVCDIWWRRDYIDDFTWPDTMKNSKVVATSFLINLFTYSERLNRLFTHSLTHSHALPILSGWRRGRQVPSVESKRCSQSPRGPDPKSAPGARATQTGRPNANPNSDTSAACTRSCTRRKFLYIQYVLYSENGLKREKERERDRQRERERI